MFQRGRAASYNTFFKVAVLLSVAGLQACSAVNFDSPAAPAEEDYRCVGDDCHPGTFQIHRIYALDLDMITDPLGLQVRDIDVQIPEGEDPLMVFIHSFQSAHWVLKGATHRVQGVFLTSNTGFFGEFYEMDTKVFLWSKANELDSDRIATANPVKRTLGEHVKTLLSPAKQQEWLHGAVAEVFPVDLGPNNCYFFEYSSSSDPELSQLLTDNSGNCTEGAPSWPL